MPRRVEIKMLPPAASASASASSAFSVSFRTMSVGTVVLLLVLFNFVNFSVFLKKKQPNNVFMGVRGGGGGGGGGMLWSYFGNGNSNSKKKKAAAAALRQQLSVEAQAFLDRHQQRYLDADRLQWWQLRHLGYLYEEHQVLLAAVLPTGTGTGADTGTDASAVLSNVGRQVIRIYNVWNSIGNNNSSSSSNKKTKTQEDPDDCEKLTLWVRVNGPELFAGSAVAVRHEDEDEDNDIDDDACHWEFPFDLQVPGNYQVEIKVLVWNDIPLLLKSRNTSHLPGHGEDEFCDSEVLDEEQRTSLIRNNTVHLKKIMMMNQEPPAPTEQQALVLSLDDYEHSGFVAFKMYLPAETCCTLCNRFRPWCLYWITPALQIQNPEWTTTGCEFLFRRNAPTTPKKYLLQSHLISKRWPAAGSAAASANQSRYPGLMNKDYQVLMGRSASWSSSPSTSSQQETAERPPPPPPRSYFLGCGWFSWTLDFPCLDGNDDQIYMASTNFTLRPPPAPVVVEAPAKEGAPSHPEVQPATSSVGVGTTLLPQLPLCELEDEVMFLKNDDYDHRNTTTTTTTQSNNQNNMPKGRWVREEWPDEEDCGPFEWDSSFQSKFRLTKFIASRPHCWHRDDFSDVGNRCMEMNCEFIEAASRWKSSVHAETQWMGVWRNYHCDYLEFTNQQLQECLSQRKIVSMETAGASIAQFLNEYLQARLAPLNLTAATTTTSNDDSVKVIFSTLNSFHRGKEKNLTDYLESNRFPPANNRTLIYWVTSAYLSSEREINMYVGVPEAMDQVSYHVMKRKGYHMIDMHDMTRLYI